MDKSSFWKEMCPIWWEEIKSWFGWGSWKETMTSIILAICIIAVLFISGNYALAIEESILGVASFIGGLFWLFVVVLISFVTANRKLHDNQATLIKSLQAEIKQEKKNNEENKHNTKEDKDNISDFITYDGLIIKKDTDESYIPQYIEVGADLAKRVIVWVMVQNSDKFIYDCIVELENFAYKGSSLNNEWTNIDFDRKALKWDVGYPPSEGKIDIGAESEKKLEIAEASLWGKMKLSHLDGYSGKSYSMDGEYCATLRIEGNVIINTIKKPITSLKYNVIFKYASTYLLKIIDIKKI